VIVFYAIGLGAFATLLLLALFVSVTTGTSDSRYERMISESAVANLITYAIIVGAFVGLVALFHWILT
jgi:hypothetical protein